MGNKSSITPKKLNKDFPPILNTLTIDQFERLVDNDSFEKCDSCGQPIYNPNFYSDKNETGLCGPCCTGEAKTIMWDEYEIDDRYLKLKINKKSYPQKGS